MTNIRFWSRWLSFAVVEASGKTDRSNDKTEPITVADIPAKFLKKGHQYFIEVFDENGNGRRDTARQRAPQAEPVGFSRRLQ